MNLIPKEFFEDTVNLMLSDDYKDRLRAEYYQTKTRYDNLHIMLVKLKAGTLSFTPGCSSALLAEQEFYMMNYLRCLEVRAEIEKIEL